MTVNVSAPVTCAGARGVTGRLFAGRTVRCRGRLRGQLDTGPRHLEAGQQCRQTAPRTPLKEHRPRGRPTEWPESALSSVLQSIGAFETSDHANHINCRLRVQPRSVPCGALCFQGEPGATGNGSQVALGGVGGVAVPHCPAPRPLKNAADSFIGGRIVGAASRCAAPMAGRAPRTAGAATPCSVRSAT